MFAFLNNVSNGEVVFLYLLVILLIYGIIKLIKRYLGK